MSKWDDFEPYKGPDKNNLPAWLEKIIVWVGVAVGIVIVGCVGGLFAVFMLTYNHGTRTLLIKATDEHLWILGATGAMVSIFIVIGWYYKWTK